MSLKNLIRGLLIFGAVYLFSDALVHLFNIRLFDALQVWPQSAIAFSGFISQLYASFVILTGLTIIEVQRDIKKYSMLVVIFGVWSLWHGSMLVYQILSGLSNNFQSLPSLLVWTPFYPFIVLVEGILLIFFGTIVVLWRIKNGKNS